MRAVAPDDPSVSKLRKGDPPSKTFGDLLARGVVVAVEAEARAPEGLAEGEGREVTGEELGSPSMVSWEKSRC